MKAYLFSGTVWAAAAALAGGMGIANAWDMPQNSYACHVTTSTAIPAVVLVQANNMTEAVAVAQRSKAVTFDGVSVRPATVVQCVALPDEKFNDATFQQNYDKMGR